MKISYISNGAFICLTLLTGCAPAASNKSKEVKQEVIVPTSTTMPPMATTPSKSMPISDTNVVYLDVRKGNASEQVLFDEIVKTNQYVIVDFYADWCGPCRNLGQTLERIAQEYRNVMFLKVNVDQHKALSDMYNVRSLPTLIFFKNGSNVYTERGNVSSSSLKSLIEKYLR